MAKVILDLDDAKNGKLPRVCICCGEAAPQNFRSRLGYWGKAIVVQIPLCHWHKNRFRWRFLSIAAGLPLGFVLFFCGVVITLVGIDHNNQVTSYYLFALILLGLGNIIIFGSLLAFFFQWLSGPRISALDKLTMKMRGVAPEFVEAVRVHHEDRTRGTDRCAT
jgi:hypothetical protein